jgi:hypothetical protein
MLANPTTRDMWIKQRNLVAFALREQDPSASTIDVLLAIDLAFDDAYARRTTRDLDGVAISLAAITDLIAMTARRLEIWTWRLRRHSRRAR